MMMKLRESSHLSIIALTLSRRGRGKDRKMERNWSKRHNGGRWRGQRRASAVVLTIQICTVESNRMRGSEMRQWALLRCNRMPGEGKPLALLCGCRRSGAWGLEIALIVSRLTDTTCRHWLTDKGCKLSFLSFCRCFCLSGWWRHPQTLFHNWTVSIQPPALLRLLCPRLCCRLQTPLWLKA